MVKDKPYAHLAAFTSILVGAAHAFVVSFQHSAIPPEFWFFIAVGILQIAWGFNFYFRQTPNFYFAGTILHGGVTLLWMLTRILPAPFSSSPESFSFAGIGVAALQLTALIAAYITMVRQHKVTQLQFLLVLFFMLLVGSIGYISAKGSELIFSEIETNGHTHESEPSASEGQEHDEILPHEQDSLHEESDHHQ